MTETHEINISQKLTDLYVLDKLTSEIHRIGSDTHDSLCVNGNQVCYYNLQNGDGGTVEDRSFFGYVILRSDNGSLTDEFNHVIDKRFEDIIWDYLTEEYL